jgi:hypothetical protein
MAECITMNDTTKVNTKQLDEQRILAALDNTTLTAAAMRDLLVRMDAAIIEAEEKSRILHEAALDPMRTPGDPVAAREAATDAALRVPRLKSLLTKMQARYVEVSARERTTDYLNTTKNLRLKQMPIVAEFQNVYNELMPRIANLYGRMESMDAEIARHQADIPPNVTDYLRTCECEARGIDRHDRDNPSILKRAVLPGVDGRDFWPPRFNPAVAVVPQPYDAKYSDRWGVAQAERQAAFREQQERDAVKQKDEARVAQSHDGRSPNWW